MKLGMNTFFINMLDFDEGLQFCQEQGVQAVEVAAVGPAARQYCDVDRLLADQGELERWLDIYAAHGLEIYSFAGHGTPLVPDRRIALEYSRQFRKNVRPYGAGRAAPGWSWWPVCPKEPRAIVCRLGLSTPTCPSYATLSNGSGSGD